MAPRHTAGEVKTFQGRVSLQDMKKQAGFISPILVSPILKDTSPLESTGYPCRFCGRFHKNKDFCERQAQLLTAKIFHCNLCEDKFDTQHDLDHHYDSAHLQNRYQCTLCNRMFKHKHSLQAHMSAINQCTKSFSP